MCAEKGICDPHNLYDPNIAHEKVINTSVFQADFFLFSMQQEIEKKTFYSQYFFYLQDIFFYRDNLRRRNQNVYKCKPAFLPTRKFGKKVLQMIDSCCVARLSHWVA